MNIIFVCTGNTCRSPMAEAYAKHTIKNHCFKSAGLMAYEGTPMSMNADFALTENGVPHENSFSKILTKTDIERADLILTMSGSHKRALEALGGDKVFTLKEYAKGSYGDIADPFGGDESAYLNCFDEIKECIDSLKEKLK